MSNTVLKAVVGISYGFGFGYISRQFGLDMVQMFILLGMSCAYLLFYIYLEWLERPTSVRSTQNESSSEETLIAAQAGASTDGWCEVHKMLDCPRCDTWDK